MSAPVWRLLSTGYADGPTNMAVDEAVLTLRARGQSPPTIRFYRWRPPCLSIGYAQSMREEVDVKRCRQRGIDVVRRPTGGRAILHDRELTYSLVARDDDPLVSGGIVESYRKISEGIVRGLRLLGVDAAAGQRRDGLPASKTAACFDAVSHYEVTVNGRKIVGSAQMRRQGVILQHGSILLEVDALAMFGLLRLPSDAVREQMAVDFERQVASLGEALGREVSFDEAAAAMGAGFAEAFSVRLLPGTLSAQEKALAAELRAGKYATDAWNFLR
ncbi:MAG: lipoate--protein ligase family protein [Bacteroidetes bacterium]|nr:lipoate--protein ligase family protein [Bacteroidota bacterium]MCL5025664.1 lipoate--protein ligase family protein [Chloroflexota bacterium]